MRPGYLVAGISAALLLAGSAGATPSASEQAMATQLFDTAQKLVEKGQYKAACPKFRESERLDPQLGTLLHLADCYEKVGKTASAWTSFKDAAQIAAKRGDPRERVARDRTAALEAKLSRLVVKVQAPSTPGLKVKLDGAVIGSAAWGLATPVDPGKHHLRASAPGKRAWERVVTVDAKQAKTVVVVPALQAAPSAGSSASATPAPAVPGPEHQQDAGVGNTQRTIGLVVAGAGVVGIGVGGVLGLLAKSRYNEASSHCDGNACDSTGVAIRHDAVGRGNVATIVFAAGAGVLAAGGVLWLVAPRAKTEVGLGPGTLSVRGRF